MVAEVNRLVGDLLAAGQPLALPGIGTLMPVTRPARRISKRQVVPPARAIDFSSEVKGYTLPQRLAAAARCSEEQAEEIYGRWLGHTQSDDMLTIVGVGTLKQKHFALEPDFDKRINPQGHAPITVRRRRRFDWVMALGVLTILAACGVGIYLYINWQQNGGKFSFYTPIATAPAPVPTAAADTAAPAEAEPVAEAPTEPATPAVGTEAPAPATAAPAAPPREAVATPARQDALNGVTPLTAGHYYVVLGVFSSRENADRSVVATARTDGSLRCGIYRFGNKWMVSPFESADEEACAIFRRAHLETFPDLWIYRAR